MSGKPDGVIFHVEDKPVLMHIFGNIHAVKPYTRLSAIESARFSRFSRRLAAEGQMADLTDEEAEQLDELAGACIADILPTLPAGDLARIGWRERVDLLNAFMDATAMPTAPSAAPLTELHPRKSKNSTKLSPTSSATMAAS